MAYSDLAFSIGTTQIAVPAGATLGLRIVPMAGQVGMLLKYTSGASLVEVVGVPYGSTLTAAQLNTATGKSWLLYSGADLGQTPLEIKGAPMFYLIAQGATAVISALFYRGEGDGVNAYQN